MLAARVIPVMLCRGRSLVKGTRFVNDRVVGHALQAAKVHAARGVDELLIIDVTATAERRGPDLAMIEELTDGCFIPVTVGGGIRSLDQITALLRAGADKVLIGAYASECPEFVREAADHFGSQAIVVSVDHDDAHGDHAAAWARLAERQGSGEILLNNRSRDGLMCGLDKLLIREVSAAVGVPVIACGGCRDYADVAAALDAGASAVGVGALFTFEDCTPREAAQYLQSKGREARV